ncbi:PIN domain-containing protein [Funiculus sociatus GB2-M2]|uniref:PIN domain-containing protein n=1 Tax=Cyanophyceae TaxID=3028117 RepID=UPI0018F03E36|nr:PIN domain-containing protein [Trichocoleus sp. FACHB-90]
MKLKFQTEISSMATLRVLLDSCVILPMPLCDTLLRAAEAGLYEVYFSQKILDDATGNLVKQGRMTDPKAASFQAIIKRYFPEAIVEVPQELVAVMTNDPGDRHVVAAAIVAKADVIVTDNLKDFQAADLAPWGIEAWHQDDFLVYLDDLFPEEMLEVIRQQAADLTRPPSTVTELLDRLERNNRVPKFARKISDRTNCET